MQPLWGFQFLTQPNSGEERRLMLPEICRQSPFPVFFRKIPEKRHTNPATVTVFQQGVTTAEVRVVG